MCRWSGGQEARGWLSHLGEVKSTGLRTGPTPGGHTDGAAGSDEGAVDLPGPQTGTQAPDMLGNGGEGQTNSLLLIMKILTLKARQAKFTAAQKARKGAKSVVRRR